MNYTTRKAALIAAKACIHGAERAKLAGNPRLAAELCAAGERAIAALEAAAPQRLDPNQSRARAIASVMLQALN